MDISKQKITIRNPGNKKISLDHLCTTYAFLLTAAACVIGSTGASALMLVITVLYAPLILMPQFLLGPILFFSIFDDYLLAGSGASASRFVTLFYIAGAVITIFQKGTIKKSSLYFVVLIFVGVLLSFYSTQGYTSFPISYILNVILAIAMINFSATSAKKVAKQLHLYAVLALAFVYFLFIKNGLDSLMEGGRMSIDENTNSNALAMGLAIVMALLVSDLLLFKKHTLLNILLIGADLVALFFTGSRTALLAAVIAALLLCIINAQDKRSRRKAFLFLILSVALLLLIYNILEKSFPLLMARFTVENVEKTGGTGRFDIWESFFVHFFPEHWFIGMGFDPGNLYYGILSLNKTPHGAHNLIIEILSKTGVVGLALYTVCFTNFFGTALKKLQINKPLIISISIVLTILINGIGEDVLTTRFLWYGIGLGYMLINTGMKESEKLSGGNQNA